mgnify:CR=1 FL=1
MKIQSIQSKVDVLTIHHMNQLKGGNSSGQNQTNIIINEDFDSM